MTTTFNGAAFGMLTTDFVPFGISQDLNVSIRHIPFSDLNDVQIGGRGPKTLSGTIRVAYSTLAAWRGYLGTTGILIVDSISYGTAVLTKLTSIRYDPHRIYVLADAEFVVEA